MFNFREQKRAWKIQGKNQNNEEFNKSHKLELI